MKIKVLINQDGTINGECAVKIKTTFGISPEQLELQTGKKVNMIQYEQAFIEHRKISAKSALKKFGRKSRKWGQDE